MNTKEIVELLQGAINKLLEANSAAVDSDTIIDGIRISEYWAAPDRASRFPGLGNKIMLRQYQQLSLPHPYVQWATGVLPSQAGDNTNWIQKYELLGWKGMYQNAESAGEMEPVVILLSKGEEAFKQAFYSMYWSPWGQAWLLDERTRGMRPRAALPPETRPA